MRIAEIYKSVQGEGRLTGTESVFVRASGCNLRCWFCDTPHTSWHAEGDDLSVDEIIVQIDEWLCSHVVITGGEPMLFAELIPLCERLGKLDRHVTVETAGTLYLPVRCDLMSISPKLSNSTPPLDDAPKWRKRHERSRFAPDVIRRLVDEHEYQVKFVVDAETDCDEILECLQKFPEINRERVQLMPQGTEIDELLRTSEWLQPYCEANGFQFCHRRQIEWFGLVRGT